MIKTLITSVIIASSVSSIAMAETYTVHAEVTSVTVANSVITEYHLTPVCTNVQVPITETRRQGGGSGDALAGMIIGGLIGKGATGNDRGAAVGAVIGGMMGAEGNSYQVVTGYRSERQCHNEYKSVQVNVPDGYLIEYNWNGLTGTVTSNTRYHIGDDIMINITMN